MMWWVREQVLQPYGKIAADLLLEKMQAKSIWVPLLRKYERPYSVLLVADDGGTDRRALSVAFTIADVLHHDRAATISKPSDENWCPGRKDPIPNKYIADTLRLGRYMILDRNE